jgi:hypothetical protein
MPGAVCRTPSFRRLVAERRGLVRSTDGDECLHEVFRDRCDRQLADAHRPEIVHRGLQPPAPGRPSCRQLDEPEHAARSRRHDPVAHLRRERKRTAGRPACCDQIAEVRHDEGMDHEPGRLLLLDAGLGAERHGLPWLPRRLPSSPELELGKPEQDAHPPPRRRGWRLDRARPERVAAPRPPRSV